MSEIETLKRQLADAKGRIQAVELSQRETERNAKIAVAQAEALKAETEASLETAADQMRVAHAVGCAIFGMTQLSRSFMARKIAAARVTHREAGLVNRLDQMVTAVEKNDQESLKKLAEASKSAIATIRADGEANRIKFYEHFLGQGFSRFDSVFEALVKE